MLEKLAQSAGPVVGYKVKGKLAKEDYAQLEPEIQALSEAYPSGVGVLLDLEEFAGEEVKAWLPDLKFGRRFHDKIARMAIVGDKRWERWLTAFVDPFYAKEGKYFHTDETGAAWEWVGDSSAYNA